jgi:hypothetical protein
MARRPRKGRWGALVETASSRNDDGSGAEVAVYFRFWHRTDLSTVRAKCLLITVKQTSRGQAATSQIDPYRTLINR